MKPRLPIALGLLGLLGVLGACGKDRDVCADLQRDLSNCGVSVSSDLVCDPLDPAQAEELTQTFEERGCQALVANASGGIDRRVCDLGGYACPEPPTPTPSGARPRYPLVFASGIDGSATFDWNPRIFDGLRTSGVAAEHVKLSSWASTADRASDLWTAVERTARGAGKVNLVCYAVGGIDCRFLVSPAGLFAGDPATAARAALAVASVTTIATPHRGTRVADTALAALRSGTATDLLAALDGAGASSLPPADGSLAKALDALTVDAMKDFDARVPDANGVYYQSFAGVSHVLGKSSAKADRAAVDACEGTFFRRDGTEDVMNELLWVTAPFAGAVSDGMVAVESAKHGVFRGCIPADHYDVIGQIGHVARDVNTGFDDVRFYTFVASDLAERGF